MAEWTQEQIDRINAEMAGEILAEVAEVLEAFGCCHGHDMKSTPPMFYPQAIGCALQAAYERGKSGLPLGPRPEEPAE